MCEELLPASASAFAKKPLKSYSGPRLLAVHWVPLASAAEASSPPKSHGAMTSGGAEEGSMSITTESSGFARVPVVAISLKEAGLARRCQRMGLSQIGLG